MILYKDGEKRIQNALDVRAIIETNENLKLIKNLLFSKQSRMLLRLQRYKQLEFGGSESDRSSQDITDFEDLREDGIERETFIQTLAGWQAKTVF